MIWVKYVPYLKGETNRNNPIRVSEDIIRVPKEFFKLYKDVLLTMDVFFVDNIPFFLTLIRKIDITAVSYLLTYKSRDIFKAFGAFMYYI